MVIVLPTVACGTLRLEINGPLVGVTTFNVPVALMEPEDAVIVDVPRLDAVANPALLMVATAVDDEVQATELVRF